MRPAHLIVAYDLGLLLGWPGMLPVQMLQPLELLVVVESINRILPYKCVVYTAKYGIEKNVKIEIK